MICSVVNRLRFISPPSDRRTEILNTPGFEGHVTGHITRVSRVFVRVFPPGSVAPTTTLLVSDGATWPCA
jgi:hypothetical protein